MGIVSTGYSGTLVKPEIEKQTDTCALHNYRKRDKRKPRCNIIMAVKVRQCMHASPLVEGADCQTTPVVGSIASKRVNKCAAQRRVAGAALLKTVFVFHMVAFVVCVGLGLLCMAR